MNPCRSSSSTIHRCREWPHWPLPPQRVRRAMQCNLPQPKAGVSGDLILPRFRSSSSNTSAPTLPPIPDLRHPQGERKTIDWCSSTSSSKSGCQLNSLSFASTLLSAEFPAAGCKALRVFLGRCFVEQIICFYGGAGHECPGSLRLKSEADSIGDEKPCSAPKMGGAVCFAPAGYAAS